MKMRQTEYRDKANSNNIFRMAVNLILCLTKAIIGYALFIGMIYNDDSTSINDLLGLLHQI